MQQNPNVNDSNTVKRSYVSIYLTFLFIGIVLILTVVGVFTCQKFYFPKKHIHLVIKIDMREYFNNMAKNRDECFDNAWQSADEEITGSEVEFMQAVQNKLKENGTNLDRYYGISVTNRINEYISEQKEIVTIQTMKILSTRMKDYGIKKHIIQKTENNSIIIKIPPVENLEFLKNLLIKRAILEFKLVKDREVYFDVIGKIDNLLAHERKVISPKEIQIGEMDMTQSQQMDQESQDKMINVSELFGESTIAEDEKIVTKKEASILVDENTFDEHPFLSLFRTRYGQEVIVPVMNVKTVDRILTRDDIQKLFPSNAQFLWSSEILSITDNSYTELFLVNKKAEITGKFLTNARVKISSDVHNAGLPEVHFTLDRQGSRIFSRITCANIGKKLAIILDDSVLSAPRIQTRIPHGRAQITGITNIEEAKLIAIVLNSGALPAPIQIIDERTINQ